MVYLQKKILLLNFNEKIICSFDSEIDFASKIKCQNAFLRFLFRLENSIFVTHIVDFRVKNFVFVSKIHFR